MKTVGTKTLYTALAVSLLVAACTGDSSEQQIAAAKSYLQKNDTQAAAIQVKNALQTNSNLPEARFLLGSILLREGNAKAAETEFRKAIAVKYPENLVVPELARSMLMLGKVKKVIDEFGSTRFELPAANANLQTTLASAYEAEGKLDLAEAALSTALQADPTYAPALLAKAHQKATARDFDGALQVTQAVITKDPGNADAWKQKGDMLLIGKNEVEGALAAYRKSVEVNPAFVPGHLALASVLLRQGKLDDAVKQLEQLKRLATNSPQTKYLEGQLALRRKDSKLAQELSQQLLRSFPNNPAMLQLAGAVELQLNSLTQAEIYLTRATRAAPQMTSARRLLILTYSLSGQSAKAIAALDAAKGKDDMEPGLFALAGEVYLQNGDAAKAEEYFSKALKLKPDSARTRTALAVTHLAKGQTETGFDELQAISATDGDTTADLALISARWRRGEFDKALEAIERLEAKQPDRPMAANLRGRMQLAKGDSAAARKSFERALTIDPSYFPPAATLAALDIADRKPGDAKRRFEELLAKNPKNVQALISLAELAAAQGASTAEVAGLLTKAVDADPMNATPRLMLIELYLRAHDVKQASSVAQNAAAALPDSPEVLDALGRTQLASGNANEAIATFGRLALVQPLSPLPHLRLAGAYSANKNKLAAERSLRKALEITPDQPDAQRALITLALESKRYQDALTIARTIQKQRPNAGFGYSLEGDIEGIQKHWVAAANAYRSSLQRAPFTDVAIRLYAVTVDAGKADEAEKFAATWMSAHPRDSKFSSHLGAMAMAHNDYAAAERHFTAVLKIQPNDPSALNNLALVTYYLHKEGALEYAERANRLVPNQPLFMDTLALILSAKGDYSKAIELEVKAVAMQPTNAELRLNLAKFYIAAGDKPRAKVELDVLTKLGDKYPSHAEVTVLLKTL